jgi:hypothetical protein
MRMMEALFTSTCRRWDAFEVNGDGVGVGKFNNGTKEKKKKEFLLFVLYLTW